MGSIIFFIIFLVVAFFGVLLFRIIAGAWKMVRAVRRVFTPPTDDDRGPRKRRAKEEPKPKKAKKIDPTVGEYVEFEEVACNVSYTSTTTESGTTTRIETEEQIVDAEWEDIK